jgi:hypothetical protein
MPVDPSDPNARRARIDRLIEAYRVVKRRRLVRRAMRLWRHAEIHQQLARLEAPPERVH